MVLSSESVGRIGVSVGECIYMQTRAHTHTHTGRTKSAI